MPDSATAPNHREPGEGLRPALAEPPEGMPVAQLLQIADDYRREQRWKDAAILYRIADRTIAPSAPVKHNLALCLLGMGEAHDALAHAEAALALDQALWQSELVRVKALKSLARIAEALQAAHLLIARHPDNGDARLELANLTLHELGDARGAHALAAPLRTDPRHAEDATLTSLMARLYDRDESGEDLTREIVAFADEHLTLPDTVFASKLAPTAAAGYRRSELAPTAAAGYRRSKLAPTAAAGYCRSELARERSAGHHPRLRIALISPLLCCSPVYFFCIGALKHLAHDFDLTFIHRGRKTDWATAEFRSIACDWFDLPDRSAESLAMFIRAQHFDVLLDLGGWMDTAALRALSSKPAPRMYKWVGGQSATTGLKAFDGMLTDRWQTPRAQQALYTEPLVLLRQGYVTYSAPSYMPAVARSQKSERALGVISNPAKVSEGFLDALVQKLAGPKAKTLARPLKLRFIDARYRHAPTRARIEAALSPLHARRSAQGGQVEIEFVTPADHPAYLAELAKLDAVLDTQPYSGGLTTVEALALGVPCLTRAGTLFSERHSHAHGRYAGMELAHADFDKTDLAALFKSAGKPRQSLISSQSKRVDHAGLARELASLLQHA